MTTAKVVETSVNRLLMRRCFIWKFVHKQCSDIYDRCLDSLIEDEILEKWNFQQWNKFKRDREEMTTPVFVYDLKMFYIRNKFESCLYALRSKEFLWIGKVYFIRILKMTWCKSKHVYDKKVCRLVQMLKKMNYNDCIMHIINLNTVFLYAHEKHVTWTKCLLSYIVNCLFYKEQLR